MCHPPFVSMENAIETFTETLEIQQRQLPKPQTIIIYDALNIISNNSHFTCCCSYCVAVAILSI